MAGNEASSAAAAAADANTLKQLRQRIEQLEAQQALAKTLKPKTPESYDGDKNTLQGFLTKLRAYHLFYAGNFPNETAKVVHAATLLTEDALAWFEPIWSVTGYSLVEGTDSDLHRCRFHSLHG